jgi:hypothetical protein
VRSTTTSRVMKGAAVSLRLSLRTLSAQGECKKGQQTALSSAQTSLPALILEEDKEIQRGVCLAHSHTARWTRPGDEMESL